MSKPVVSAKGPTSHNVEVVTSLKLGEPSEKLLIVPASYTETTPDDVEKKHMAMSGGEPYWGLALLQNMKKEYAKNDRE